MAGPDFLLDPGTNGFIATPFNLFTTELNTLGSGSAATSSVAGPFTQTNFGSAIEVLIQFTSGGAFTPTAGGVLSGWWLESPDGNSTWETLISTPSTTVPAIGRAPDWTVPVYEGGAAWAANNFRFSLPARAPYPGCKVVVQNISGVALPASGNIIKAYPVAWKY